MAGRAGTIGGAVLVGGRGSVGGRTGGIKANAPVFGGTGERLGYGGGINATFSSRALKDAARPSLSIGRTEQSAAGRKAAIGANEKFTVLSSGNTQRRGGLGEHFVPGYGRNKPSGPESQGTSNRGQRNAAESPFNPLKLQAFDPVSSRKPDISSLPEMRFRNTAKPEAGAKKDGITVKRSGKYGLSPEYNAGKQPQRNVDRARSIMQELRQDFTPVQKHAGIEIRPTIPFIDVPIIKQEARPLLPNSENPKKSVPTPEVSTVRRAPAIDAIRSELKKIEVKTKQSAQIDAHKAVIAPIHGLESLVAKQRTGSIGNEKYEIVHESHRLTKVNEGVRNVKKALGSNVSAMYLQALAERDSLRSLQVQEALKTSKKPNLKEQAQAVVQRLQTKVSQELRILSNAAEPLPRKDAKPARQQISQSAAEVRKLVTNEVVRVSGAQLQSEVTRLASPLAAQIGRTEAEAQAAIMLAGQVQQPTEQRIAAATVVPLEQQTMLRQAAAQMTEQAVVQATEQPTAATQHAQDTGERTPQPPIDKQTKPNDPTSGQLQVSLDEAAAAARVMQGLIGVAEAAKRSTHGDVVDGYEVARFMDVASENVKSHIVKTGPVSRPDGSIPRFISYVRSERAIPKNNAADKLVEIVRKVPPVAAMPPGDQVTESDVKLVVQGEQVIYEAA